MKKCIKLLFVSFIFCFLIAPTEFIFADNISDLETPINNVERKNNIVWRYKNVNGVLYKRQYDVTNKKWIGSWIKA